MKLEDQIQSLKPLVRGPVIVFPIVVPPLRDHAGDIPLLASAFASRYAKEIGRPIEPPSAECRERLKAYNWPGNVRELQNVIERAVITSQDGRLNLARALPDASTMRVPCVRPDDPQPCRRVRTVAELQDDERTSFLPSSPPTGAWRAITAPLSCSA